jgi:hypothetical protein
MFRSFARTAKRNLPFYSLLRTVPSRGLPQDLADREASLLDDKGLVDQNRYGPVPKEDGPTFATFLKTGDGFLYLRLPSCGENWSFGFLIDCH